MHRDRSRSPVARRPPGNQVYIGNVSYTTRDGDVTDFFERQMGLQVERVQLMLDRETGRARGFGFVTFTAPEMVTQAVERANGCARLRSQTVSSNCGID